MRLEITEPAEKDLSNLDKKTQKRIKTTLERLITHPQAVDLKKLRGNPERWRIRVGDWRVILQIDREKEVLYIMRIRHRREAYR